MKYTFDKYLTTDVYKDLYSETFKYREIVSHNEDNLCNACCSEVFDSDLWLEELVHTTSYRERTRVTCVKCLDKYLDNFYISKMKYSEEVYLYCNVFNDENKGVRLMIYNDSCICGVCKNMSGSIYLKEYLKSHEGVWRAACIECLNKCVDNERASISLDFFV